MADNKRKTFEPMESEEQQKLFQWAAWNEGKYPELRCMYHIPNGGLRNKAVAVRLAAEGVKRGVPDICLPVARGTYHGFYIELKREYSGRTSDDQNHWIAALRESKYAAIVCHGAKQAIKNIEMYLDGEPVI